MRNIKKGQMTLGEAPTVVLIVGLTFLLMATVALVSQKYGEAIPTSKTATTYNETVSQAQLTTKTYALKNSSLCNAEQFTVTEVLNESNEVVISSGNYTYSTTTGVIYNTTNSYSVGSWKVSYTNKYSGVACDVTVDLNTEIGNNTSIAGIVLTISLVGIVLSILIGVFLGVRNQTV